MPSAAQPACIINKIEDRKQHKVTDAIIHNFLMAHIYLETYLFNSLALHKYCGLQIYPIPSPWLVQLLSDVKTTAPSDFE